MCVSSFSFSPRTRSRYPGALAQRVAAASGGGALEPIGGGHGASGQRTERRSLEADATHRHIGYLWGGGGMFGGNVVEVPCCFKCSFQIFCICARFVCDGFIIPVAYSYLKWGGIVPQKVILFGLILAKRLS